MLSSISTRWPAGAAALTLSLALAGCGGPPGQPTAFDRAKLFVLGWIGQAPPPPPAPPAPPPPQVTVETPQTRPVTDTAEFVGRFVPTDSVEIRARVAGYLDSVNFRDGQLVQKGDLLFIIDKRPFQTAVDQAKADLQRAQVAVDLAQAELTRAERLIRDKTVSEATYDQRFQAKRTADSNVVSARANVRRAELDLEFTELRAPVTGRIGDRRVAPGNLVTANTSLLATIVSVDPIYVEFTVDEGFYIRAKRQDEPHPGATGSPVREARFKLFDETEFKNTGTLSFMDNVLDQSSGTIRLRALVQNPDGLFTPGMFATVRLAAGGEYEALTVPEAAILADQLRRIVLVVGEDGTVVPKVVEQGGLVDGRRIIRSGIAKTDRIVVNGLMRARPGAKVTPITATTPVSAPAPATPPTPKPAAG